MRRAETWFQRGLFRALSPLVRWCFAAAVVALAALGAGASAQRAAHLTDYAADAADSAVVRGERGSDYARFAAGAAGDGGDDFIRPWGDRAFRVGAGYLEGFLNRHIGGAGEQVQTRVVNALINEGRAYDFEDYLQGKGDSVWRELSALPDYQARRLIDYWVTASEYEVARLNFVRRVDFDYTAPLGGRDWSAAIGVAGAARETADDVLAWELRGFSGENQDVGANIGGFYRWVEGGIDADSAVLLGINTFFDYAQHADWGDFLRWSFGADFHSRWVDLYGNWYEAITGGQAQPGGETAYSRSGYDVGAQANFWRWMSAGLTYYRWLGEYGDADQEGIRYHLSFYPSSLAGGDLLGNLEARLEYDSGSGADDGSAEFGGALNYVWYVNEATALGERAAGRGGYNPRAYFYSPVTREYSQRIDIVKTDYISRSDGGASFGRDALATVTAQAATLTLDGGSWTIELSERSEMVYVGTAHMVSLLEGDLVYNRPDGAAGQTLTAIAMGAAATLNLLGTYVSVSYTPDGGADNKDAITVALSEGTVAITVNTDEVDWAFEFDESPTPGGAAPSVVVVEVEEASDPQTGAPIQVTTTLNVSPLAAGDNANTVAVGAAPMAWVVDIRGEDSDSDIAYEFVRANPEDITAHYDLDNIGSADDNSGSLKLTLAFASEQDHTVAIVADDGHSAVTVNMIIDVVGTVDFGESGIISVLVSVARTVVANAGALATDGVRDNYEYTVAAGDDFAVAANGDVLLVNAITVAGETREVSIEVMDGYSTATLALTVEAVNPVSFTSDGAFAVPIDVSQRVVYRATAGDGAGVQVFSLLEAPAGYYRLAEDSGELTLLQAWTNAGTDDHEVVIAVADGLSSATLTVAIDVVLGAVFTSAGDAVYANLTTAAAEVYTVSASSPTEQQVTYQLIEPLDNIAIITSQHGADYASSNRSVTVRINQAFGADDSRADEVTITLRATDANGYSDFLLTISLVGDIALAPPTDAVTVLVNVASVLYTASATDGVAPSIQYNLIGDAAANFTINQQSGELSSRQIEAADRYIAVVEAKDDFSSMTASLTVDVVNPVAFTSPAASKVPVNRGNVVVYGAAASGGAGVQVFSLLDAPAGYYALDAANGELTLLQPWRDADNDDHSVTIAVRDALSAATLTVAFDVAAGAVFDSPGGAVYANLTTAANIYTVTASSPSQQQIIYSIEHTPPNIVVLNEATANQDATVRINVAYGSDTYNDGDEATITLRATDANGYSNFLLTISLVDNIAISVSAQLTATAGARPGAIYTAVASSGAVTEYAYILVSTDPEEVAEANYGGADANLAGGVLAVQTTFIETGAHTVFVGAADPFSSATVAVSVAVVFSSVVFTRETLVTIAADNTYDNWLAAGLSGGDSAEYTFKLESARADNYHIDTDGFLHITSAFSSDGVDNHEVTLIGGDKITEAKVTLSVVVIRKVELNAAPAVMTILVGSEARAFHTLSLSGGDAANYRFETQSGHGSFAVGRDSGVVTLQQINSPGVYAAVIEGRDRYSRAVVTASVIVVNPVAFTSGSNLNIPVNGGVDTVVYAAVAAGGAGTQAFSLAGAPEGYYSLNTTNGELTLLKAWAEEGEHTVSIAVADALSSATIAVTVDVVGSGLNFVGAAAASTLLLITDANRDLITVRAASNDTETLISYALADPAPSNVAITNIAGGAVIRLNAAFGGAARVALITAQVSDNATPTPNQLEFVLTITLITPVAFSAARAELAVGVGASGAAVTVAASGGAGAITYTVASAAAPLSGHYTTRNTPDGGFAVQITLPFEAADAGYHAMTISASAEDGLSADSIVVFIDVIEPLIFTDDNVAVTLPPANAALSVTLAAASGGAGGIVYAILPRANAALFDFTPGGGAVAGVLSPRNNLSGADYIVHIEADDELTKATLTVNIKVLDQLSFTSTNRFNLPIRKDGDVYTATAVGAGAVTYQLISTHPSAVLAAQQYALNGAVLNVAVAFPAEAGADHSVIIAAQDGVSTVSLTVAVNVLAGIAYVGFDSDGAASINVAATRADGAIHTVRAISPTDATISYAYVGTTPAEINTDLTGGVVKVNELSGTEAKQITLTIIATDNATSPNTPANFQLTLNLIPAVNIDAATYQTTVVAGATAAVLTVTATGGEGAYAYRVSSANPADRADHYGIGADGILRITAAFTTADVTVAHTVVAAASAADGVSGFATIAASVRVITPVTITPPTAAQTILVGQSTAAIAFAALAQGGLGLAAYTYTAPGPNLNISEGNIDLAAAYTTPNTYRENIIVSDGFSAHTVVLTLVAVAAIAIDPNQPVDLTVHAGATVALYTVTVATGGQDAKTYALLPETAAYFTNFAFDAATRVISVATAFEESEASEDNILRIAVSDSLSAATLTLRVDVVVPGPRYAADAGEVRIHRAAPNGAIYQAAAQSATSDDLRYAIATRDSPAPAPPAGVLVHPRTGDVRIGSAFTRDAARTVTVTVIASENNGQFTDEFALTIIVIGDITLAAPNANIVIAANTTPPGNTLYSDAGFVASGGSGGPYTYAIDAAAAIADFFTIDANGVQMVSPIAAGGIYLLTLKASDDFSDARAILTLNVIAPLAFSPNAPVDAEATARAIGPIYTVPANLATGGLPAKTYTMLDSSALTAHLGFGSTDRVLSITARLTQSDIAEDYAVHIQVADAYTRATLTVLVDVIDGITFGADVAATIAVGETGALLTVAAAENGDTPYTYAIAGAEPASLAAHYRFNAAADPLALSLASELPADTADHTVFLAATDANANAATIRATIRVLPRVSFSAGANDSITLLAGTDANTPVYTLTAQSGIGSGYTYAIVAGFQSDSYALDETDSNIIRYAVPSDVAATERVVFAAEDGFSRSLFRLTVHIVTPLAFVAGAQAESNVAIGNTDLIIHTADTQFGSGAVAYSFANVGAINANYSLNATTGDVHLTVAGGFADDSNTGHLLTIRAQDSLSPPTDQVLTVKIVTGPNFSPSSAAVNIHKGAHGINPFYAVTAQAPSETAVITYRLAPGGHSGVRLVGGNGGESGVLEIRSGAQFAFGDPTPRVATVSILADNSEGGDPAVFTLLVSVVGDVTFTENPINHTVAQNIQDVAIYTVTGATGGNGGPYSYTVAPLGNAPDPNYAIQDGNVLYLTSALATDTAHGLTIFVSDGLSTVDFVMSMSVISPVQIGGADNATVVVGSTGRFYTLRAAGGEGAGQQAYPYRYAVVSTNPPSVKDANNHRVESAPAGARFLRIGTAFNQAGRHTIYISAADSYSSAQKAVVVRVVNPVAFRPPLQTATVVVGRANYEFFTVAAAAGGGGPYTYELVGSDPPDHATDHYDVVQSSGVVRPTAAIEARSDVGTLFIRASVRTFTDTFSAATLTLRTAPVSTITIAGTPSDYVATVVGDKRQDNLMTVSLSGGGGASVYQYSVVGAEDPTSRAARYTVVPDDTLARLSVRTGGIGAVSDHSIMLAATDTYTSLTITVNVDVQDIWHGEVTVVNATNAVANTPFVTLRAGAGLYTDYSYAILSTRPRDIGYNLSQTAGAAALAFVTLHETASRGERHSVWIEATGDTYGSRSTLVLSVQAAETAQIAFTGFTPTSTLTLHTYRGAPSGPTLYHLRDAGLDIAPSPSGHEVTYATGSQRVSIKTANNGDDVYIILLNDPGSNLSYRHSFTLTATDSRPNRPAALIFELTAHTTPRIVSSREAVFASGEVSVAIYTVVADPERGSGDFSYGFEETHEVTSGVGYAINATSGEIIATSTLDIDTLGVKRDFIRLRITDNKSQAVFTPKVTITVVAPIRYNDASRYHPTITTLRIGDQGRIHRVRNPDNGSGSYSATIVGYNPSTIGARYVVTGSGSSRSVLITVPNFFDDVSHSVYVEVTDGYSLLTVTLNISLDYDTARISRTTVIRTNGNLYEIPFAWRGIVATIRNAFSTDSDLVRANNQARFQLRKIPVSDPASRGLENYMYELEFRDNNSPQRSERDYVLSIAIEHQSSRTGLTHRRTVVFTFNTADTATGGEKIVTEQDSANKNRLYIVGTDGYANQKNSSGDFNRSLAMRGRMLRADGRGAPRDWIQLAHNRDEVRRGARAASWKGTLWMLGGHKEEPGNNFSDWRFSDQVSNLGHEYRFYTGNTSGIANFSNWVKVDANNNDDHENPVRICGSGSGFSYNSGCNLSAGDFQGFANYGGELLVHCDSNGSNCSLLKVGGVWRNALDDVEELMSYIYQKREGNNDRYWDRSRDRIFARDKFGGNNRILREGAAGMSAASLGGTLYVHIAIGPTNTRSYVYRTTATNFRAENVNWVEVGPGSGVTSPDGDTYAENSDGTDNNGVGAQIIAFNNRIFIVGGVGGEGRRVTYQYFDGANRHIGWRTVDASDTGITTPHSEKQDSSENGENNSLADAVVVGDWLYLIGGSSNENQSSDNNGSNGGAINSRRIHRSRDGVSWVALPSGDFDDDNNIEERDGYSNVYPNANNRFYPHRIWNHDTILHAHP